jgi:hypothetical protein
LCHPEQTVQEVLVTTSSRRGLAAAKRLAAIGHEPKRQAFSLSFLPFVKTVGGNDVRSFSIYISVGNGQLCSRW